MPAPTFAAPICHNEDDRRVLSRFAAGKDVSEIAEELSRTREAVLSVVSRCHLNRSTAREGVRVYDAGLQAKRPTPPPEPQPAVEVKLAPAKPKRATGVAATVVAPTEPAADEVEPAAAEPTVRPEPEPAAEAAAQPAPAPELEPTPDLPDDIEGLLKTAEASGIGRARETARIIRGHLTRLAEIMRFGEEERVLRATIGVLTVQLSKANEELRALTGQPVLRPAPQSLTTAERGHCRAWGKAHGRVEATRGRVSQSVIDDWRAAGSPESARPQ